MKVIYSFYGEKNGNGFSLLKCFWCVCVLIRLKNSERKSFVAPWLACLLSRGKMEERDVIS